MTTTENLTISTDIVDRITLGYVASRTGNGPGESKTIAQEAIVDGLSGHVNSDRVRASLTRLVTAGRIEIAGKGTYRFAVDPEFPAADRDIDSVIMAYAHGRGVAVEFDLNDVCALPMLGHVPVRRLTVALRELVRHEQLDVTGSRWCLPLPTGSDRALIDELAAWFGALDPSTSVTVAVITHDFRSAPTHLLHVALDYLTTTGAISRVRPGTYMRNV